MANRNEDNTSEEQVDELLDVLYSYGDEDFPQASLREIENKVPGLIIARAGGSNPFTAEGVLGDYPFYFKYRESGKSSLRVGPNPVEQPLYLSRDFFEPENGLSVESFKELFMRLVARLDVAPFRYEFAGKKISLSGKLNELHITATDELEVFRSWGFTAEEAFSKISEPSAELSKIGLSEAIQAEIFELQSVNPTPINSDERIFPDPQPVFSVSQ